MNSDSYINDLQLQSQVFDPPEDDEDEEEEESPVASQGRGRDGRVDDY